VRRPDCITNIRERSQGREAECGGLGYLGLYKKRADELFESFAELGSIELLDVLFIHLVDFGYGSHLFPSFFVNFVTALLLLLPVIRAVFIVRVEKPPVADCYGEKVV
jgi:hypothetical protein